MTACPDWRALVAHRAARRAGEPSGWHEALAHLEGCPACRRAAFAADPTLLFSRLAGVPKPAPASEVDDMRRAVAALRRASRVAPEIARPVVSWARAAAAAGLLAGLLSLAPAGGRGVAPGGATVSGVVPAAAFASDDLSRLPVFEGLDRPGRADVYELAGDDLLVVMIVDETLDV